MSTLRIELFDDEEAGSWHFRVPALRGGTAGGRAEAEDEARAAMAFALEGDPGELTRPP